MGKGLDKSSSDKIINWEEQEVAPASEMRDLLAQRTSWNSSFFRVLSQRPCSKLEPDDRKIPWWNRKLVSTIKFSIVGFKTWCTWNIITTGLGNSFCGRIQMTLNVYGLFESNS